jgi:CubicO group peptidase (beta-lactamase class C family)
MKLKLPCLLFVAAVAVNATAQDKAKELDQYFTTLAANNRFNGNILVAENGKVVYEHSFGYANFPAKRPNTALSSFPIASITKTITATAILQLKEKGKLQLTDPVNKYLPEFPYPGVTITHLLSHTSGVPDYEQLFFKMIDQHPDTVFTNKDIVPAAIAGKVPLNFHPGEDFRYNNVNFNLLAMVVEKLSEQSFEAYIKRYILQPAGMSSTSSSEFFTRKDKHLVTQYRYPHTWSAAIEKPDTAAEFKKMYNLDFKGHGDLISTAHDLLKYDEALYSGKLLNNTTLQEAFTPIKLPGGRDNPQRYGLGWGTRYDSAFGESVLHTGGLIGLRTILLRNITKHQTVIIFDNTSNDTYSMAYQALKILNGIKPLKPVKNGARQYAIALMQLGCAKGNEVLSEIEKDTARYILAEDDLNVLGYEFMAANMDTAAYEVFKANMRLFPASWNVYDSYAEILAKMGRKEEAIRMYQKSIELNAGNDNGRKILASLIAQQRPAYQPEPYVPDSKELHDEIVKQDSIFFNAYNNCDLETQRSFLADTLEFYHDRSGLSTSKEQVMESTQRYICGKVKRELVEGSVEVYPIHNYGAVEIGYHRFHNLAENSVSRPGKFITIWQKKGNGWQITRIISLH